MTVRKGRALTEDGDDNDKDGVDWVRHFVMGCEEEEVANLLVRLQKIS